MVLCSELLSESRTLSRLHSYTFSDTHILTTAQYLIAVSSGTSVSTLKQILEVYVLLSARDDPIKMYTGNGVILLEG